MGTVPRQQAGVASGVLIMLGRMGTAMGQALSPLILSLAATGLVRPIGLVSGFGACALFLAAVALLAASLATLRGGRSLETLLAEPR
jgi:hypothetical protein